MAWKVKLGKRATNLLECAAARAKKGDQAEVLVRRGDKAAESLVNAGLCHTQGIPGRLIYGIYITPLGKEWLEQAKLPASSKKLEWTQPGGGDRWRALRGRFRLEVQADGVWSIAFVRRLDSPVIARGAAPHDSSTRVEEAKEAAETTLNNLGREAITGKVVE